MSAVLLILRLAGGWRLSPVRASLQISAARSPVGRLSSAMAWLSTASMTSGRIGTTGRPAAVVVKPLSAWANSHNWTRSPDSSTPCSPGRAPTGTKRSQPHRRGLRKK
uniref:Uncharacterized protein hrbD n=1 Tax=Streptomyces sp. 2238-SVT4 TaxID=681626 RepID=D5MRH7_9ACTN|nr:hypothetical protein [Streptomyces sp. 2238-SVT4]